MSVEISDLLEWRLPLIERYQTSQTAPTGTACRRLFIPDVPEFHAAIGELLSRLCFESVWQERAGGLTPIEMVMLATQMLADFETDECPPETEGESVLYQHHARSIVPANSDAIGLTFPGGDWRRVRLEIMGRSTATGEHDLWLRFNGDSAYNYGYHSAVMATSVALQSADQPGIRISDSLTGSNRGAGQVARTVLEITRPVSASVNTYANYRTTGFYRSIVGGGYWNQSGAAIYDCTLVAAFGQIAAGTEIDVFTGWDLEYV